VLEALRKTLVSRPGARDLVQQSDRGSQYASPGYRNALDEAGTTGSMSRRVGAIRRWVSKARWKSS
jgi:transposase InsO family protein